MQSLIVGKDHENKRIDRFLKETFPNMPVSALYKAFRKRDIKVNGIRVKDDCILLSGDKVEVYIIDDILYGAPVGNHKLNKGFSIIYEDANILVVDKKQGIPVHPDREQSENTLIQSVQSYLKEKGEYRPEDPSSFPPSLCHRLDRNTGGLVLIARNDESLKVLLDKIKNKEIRKYYQCLVNGRMENQAAELRAYLEKDEGKSRVFISKEKIRHSLEIITRYSVIHYDEKSDTSLLEVELVTGRTHQIRAHLSYIGHPIIGDGKYGTNRINRMHGTKYQSLWATKIVFDFKGNAGRLNYLRGRKFEVEPGFTTLPALKK